MLVRNGVSRYHIVMQAIRLAMHHSPEVAASATEKLSYFTYKLKDHREYIQKHGEDPEEITNWKWSRPDENSRSKRGIQYT